MAVLKDGAKDDAEGLLVVDLELHGTRWRFVFTGWHGIMNVALIAAGALTSLLDKVSVADVVEAERIGRAFGQLGTHTWSSAHAVLRNEFEAALKPFEFRLAEALAKAFTDCGLRHKDYLDKPLGVIRPGVSISLCADEGDNLEFAPDIAPRQLH